MVIWVYTHSLRILNKERPSAVFNKSGGVEKLISRHRNVPKAPWPGLDWPLLALPGQPTNKRSLHHTSTQSGNFIECHGEEGVGLGWGVRMMAPIAFHVPPESVKISTSQKLAAILQSCYSGQEGRQAGRHVVLVSFLSAYWKFACLSISLPTLSRLDTLTTCAIYFVGDIYLYPRRRPSGQCSGSARSLKLIAAI